MLTMIPLLNPPRGWGKKRKKKSKGRRKLYGAAAASRALKRAVKKNNRRYGLRTTVSVVRGRVRVNPKKSRRKPAKRETSSSVRRRRKNPRRRRSKEVAVMARRRRKKSRRGRGGRFVSRKNPRRRRRTSSRRRRRSNPAVAVNPPKRRRRRRRRNPTVLVRRGRRYKTLVKAKRVYTRRTRGRYKGSLRRLNPRRRRRSRGRRRNPVVIVRRGRRLRSLGYHRRVYKRRSRGPYKGTIRRMNPFGIKLPGFLSDINLDLGIQGIQVGAGLLLAKVAPGYVANAIGKPAWGRGWTGLGLGVVSSALVASIVSISPSWRRAGRNLLIGAAANVGVELLSIALGKVSRMRSPAQAAQAQAGMGALVSPEAMIETQALLGGGGLGDFVQLSGGIPRRDFAGMGDYIEFGSQQAGANALASQLAPASVFNPGPDEKF